MQRPIHHFARAGTLLLVCCFPPALAGQTQDMARIRALASGIAQSVGAESECSLEVLGDPQLDESQQLWLVPYSAAGERCERAVVELRRRGEEGGILFFRRPTLGQVRVFLRETVLSVESRFACRVTLGTRPRTSPSGRWSVEIIASGPDCDAAVGELNRLGRELEVSFLRRPEPGSGRSLF